MTETISSIRQALLSVYSADEARNLARMVISHVTGLSSYQLLLCKDRELSGPEKKKAGEITERLKSGEPIQYIIGECEFYGLKFRVNPSTLIPRPETEELVEEIITGYGEGEKQILDIGTGSGCIAISLAFHLKNARVDAIDISPEALETAAGNAKENNVNVSFIQADILKPESYTPAITEFYDIIVSNPPYVTEFEKGSIEKNVLDYEPHTALFVTNEDPLLFYRVIAEFGQKQLKQNGYLYFEINREYGKKTVELLQTMGYREITLKKDLCGNDRMIKAKR